MKSKINLLFLFSCFYFATFLIVEGSTNLIKDPSYSWPWFFISNAVVSEETVLSVTASSSENFFVSSSTPDNLVDEQKLNGGSAPNLVSVDDNIEGTDTEGEGATGIGEDTGNDPGPEVAAGETNLLLLDQTINSSLGQSLLTTGTNFSLSDNSVFAERLGFLFVLERLFRNNGSGVLGGEGSLLGNLLILDQLFR